ncbi:unnamed protein product [Boreogadus saida]
MNKSLSCLRRVRVTELDEDTVVAAVGLVVVVVCEGGAEQPSGSRDKALEPRQPLESPNPLGESVTISCLMKRPILTMDIQSYGPPPLMKLEGASLRGIGKEKPCLLP